MTARGTAAGGDPVGINAQLPGVAADVADGVLGVEDKVGDLHAGARRRQSIFGAGCPQAPLCQIIALVVELIGIADRPCASVEKNDRGALGRRFLSGGLEDVQRQFSLTDLLVDDLLCRPGVFGVP